MTSPVPAGAGGVDRVLNVMRGDEGVSYWMWCPVCDDAVRITDGWEWDGNETAPTFSPSILTEGGLGNVRCHSYLRAGVWEFLSDCTHDKAGQRVPMVPLPGWMVP